MNKLFIFIVLILADSLGFINQDENTENLAVLPLNNFEINTGESIMLTEQFKPIKSFEGLYEISNFGRDALKLSTASHT